MNEDRCPICGLFAERPSPISRRLERVATDPTGATLLGFLVLVLVGGFVAGLTLG